MYKHLTIAAAILVNQVGAIAASYSGAEPASVADIDGFMDELDHKHTDQSLEDVLGSSEDHNELFAALEMEMMALSAKLGYEHPENLHSMSADEKAAALDKMGEFMSHPDHQDAIDEHLSTLMENPKYKSLFASFHTDL